MFAIPKVVRHKPTGDLLITRERYEKSHHGPGYRCQPIDKKWTTCGYPDDDLEPAPPRKPGGFDMRTEIVPRIDGALPWEDVERADLALTLSNLAACAGWYVYPHIGWITKPGARSPSWARFFLSTTQGGEFTGEAHVLVYEAGPHLKPAALREAVVQAAVTAVHNKHAPAGDLAAAVLAMESSREQQAAMPSAWKVAICKHEIIDRSTAEGRMRGWHPARCGKCGINLSVDSSD